MGRAELWSELMKLTPDERIELVEDLWDSIEPQAVPRSLSKKKNLTRYAEHLRDPSSASLGRSEAQLLAR